ncbi:hypothetical protein C922_03304 [Plasmodium inui San Antonio 1]|uniref:Uncharacterized protein n=1 Tax=Plasmodium inui San Antonio 1 TaxID=1237626 RepID=W7A509_9APIC|nr:hypothetical protein C922_03304 [Plasmodium inui San Antonio 1]EUD66388.1 hypothetical protein C922_03304 [Plasmodium inui San Antonio 1]
MSLQQQKGFPFYGYMLDILSGKTGTCGGGSEGENNWTLCDLKNATSNPVIQALGEGSRLKQQGEPGIDGVMKHTASICIGLAIWAANLSKTEGRGNIFQEGACKPNDTGKRITGGTYQASKCPERGRSEEWEKYARGSPMDWSNENAKTLRVCRDIIEMLVQSFKMDHTKGKGGETVELDKDGCDQFYTLLRKWSSQSMADRIMSEWFTDGGYNVGGSKQYTLGGNDFFEVVQSLIYTEGVIDKDFSCGLKTDLSGKASSLEGKWGYKSLREAKSETHPISNRQGAGGHLQEESSKVSTGEQSAGQSPGSRNGSSSTRTGGKGTEAITSDFSQGKQGTRDRKDNRLETTSYMGGSGAGLWGSVAGGIGTLLMASAGAYGIYRILGTPGKIRDRKGTLRLKQSETLDGAAPERRNRDKFVYVRASTTPP